VHLLALLTSTDREPLEHMVSGVTPARMLRELARARTAAPELPIMAEAEARFVRALDIARRQQARSWELRAATSLSRFWQHQGKRQAAYDLLTPVYSWFTEGFDTADLQAARTLLEELEG
jgi:predicted ATPase